MNFPDKVNKTIGDILEIPAYKQAINYLNERIEKVDRAEKLNEHMISSEKVEKEETIR